MDRGEAYTKIFNTNKIERNSKKEVDKLIKQIFDEFEQKICKNCQYFDGNWNCNNKENMQTYYSGDSDREYKTKMEVSKSFGCNRFEKRN